MGIEQFIQKISVQTAVYWGAPTHDGYGDDFPDPIEISVRWEDQNELIRTENGEQVVTRAKVLVNRNVEVGGYLFLGTLDDLSSDPSNPLEEKAAYAIVRFDKIPMIKKTDEFVRIVYL